MKYKLPDPEVDTLKGEKLDKQHYDILIHEPCRVLKPDGSPLIHIVRGALQDESPCQTESDKVKGLPDNRGTSSGKGNLVGQNNQGKNILKGGYNSGTTRVAKSAFQILTDTDKFFPGGNNRGTSSGDPNKKQHTQAGYVSNTTVSREPVASGIIGYFDRYPRFPYARETSFLIKYKREWEVLQPFIHKVNNVFAEFMPDRYAIQKEVASHVSKDWIIGDTAFSTITVNKSYRTACHKDAGDLKEGFGVMTYFTTGKLMGGFLVLPAYRVAVKLQHGDIILFDVHEWHGNTPIKPLEPKAERITCVFYLREKLLQCGDSAYEIERAKKCRHIGKLYDDSEIKKSAKIKQEIFKKYGITHTHTK